MNFCIFIIVCKLQFCISVRENLYWIKIDDNIFRATLLIFIVGNSQYCMYLE